MNQNTMGGIGNQRSPNPRQPPPNYLCYNCRVPGHFINDCPNRQQQQQQQNGQQRNKNSKPPPANYICHKCSTPGT